MAKMGDKVSARQSALDAGLPIIPGTDTALSDAEVMIVQKGIQDEKRFIVVFEKQVLMNNCYSNESLQSEEQEPRN